MSKVEMVSLLKEFQKEAETKEFNSNEQQIKMYFAGMGSAYEHASKLIIDLLGK